MYVYIMSNYDDKDKDCKDRDAMIENEVQFKISHGEFKEYF